MVSVFKCLFSFFLPRHPFPPARTCNCCNSYYISRHYFPDFNDSVKLEWKIQLIWEGKRCVNDGDLEDCRAVGRDWWGVYGPAFSKRAGSSRGCEITFRAPFSTSSFLVLNPQSAPTENMPAAVAVFISTSESPT